MVGALPIAACSPDPAPDFEQTQGAVLAHARCIDEGVMASDVSADTIEEQAQRIQEGCSRERERALSLKAVPVFEATIEEYDEMQGSLATGLVAKKRNEVVK
jgi:hypothetical protein